MKDRQFPLSGEFVPPILPGAIEEQTYSRGYQRIAGLDEVGRGPLAGPVVAAAVIFPRGFSHPDIKDSKLLTASQRRKLVPSIERSAVSWGIGIVEVEEIDRINILNASLQAMVKALTKLRPFPDCLLIDGNQTIPGKLLDGRRGSFKIRPQQKTIVKGDRLCFSISAASILAKVARDALMVKLDRQYPQYGFARHKGYSSIEHLEALRRYGPCPAHRRSFKPVRDLCKGTTETTLPLFSAVKRDD
jgi:ribonuclease HII